MDPEDVPTVVVELLGDSLEGTATAEVKELNDSALSDWESLERGAQASAIAIALEEFEEFLGCWRVFFGVVGSLCCGEGQFVVDYGALAHRSVGERTD